MLTKYSASHAPRSHARVQSRRRHLVLLLSQTISYSFSLPNDMLQVSGNYYSTCARRVLVVAAQVGLGSCPLLSSIFPLLCSSEADSSALFNVEEGKDFTFNNVELSTIKTKEWMAKVPSLRPPYPPPRLRLTLLPLSLLSSPSATLRSDAHPRGRRVCPL
jgi:hypothetical protein